MFRILTQSLRRLVGPLSLLALTACAPAPIYKVATGASAATPAQVAQSPERFAQTPVIWGGRIVRVSNFPDHSEIEVLSYPLDSSQRPQFGGKQPIGGRFIISVPGYVESMNYPPGAPITVNGILIGSHVATVGTASYIYPVVQSQQYHVWTAEEMSSGHSNFSFGLGVAGGFR